jgi:hypothetical protein
VHKNTFIIHNNVHLCGQQCSGIKLYTRWPTEAKICTVGLKTVRDTEHFNKPNIITTLWKICFILCAINYFTILLLIKKRSMCCSHISSTPLLQKVNRWKTFCFNMLHTSYCCGAQYFWVWHQLLMQLQSLITSDTFACNTIFTDDYENQTVYPDHSVLINSGVLRTHELWAPRPLKVHACMYVGE